MPRICILSPEQRLTQDWEDWVDLLKVCVHQSISNFASWNTTDVSEKVIGNREGQNPRFWFPGEWWFVGRKWKVVCQVRWLLVSDQCCQVANGCADVHDAGGVLAGEQLPFGSVDALL